MFRFYLCLVLNNYSILPQGRVDEVPVEGSSSLSPASRVLGIADKVAEDELRANGAPGSDTSSGGEVPHSCLLCYKNMSCGVPRKRFYVLEP